MSSASDRRKSSGGGEESGANWMDTYGDLVTLLLTFFVLLFSFSNIDAAKWQALVGSFTGISPVSIDPISPAVAIENPIPEFGFQAAAENDETDPALMEEAEGAQSGETTLYNLRQMYSIMSDFVESGGIDAEVVMDEDAYLVRLIINERVFFETASDVVRPDAYPVLDAIIDMFREVNRFYTMLIVEGHADSRPINTARFPSNWHISAYRAVNVMVYLREVGELDPTRLAAMGYGEMQPVAPNDSEENMAKNRRVEFVAEAGDPRRISQNTQRAQDTQDAQGAQDAQDAQDIQEDARDALNPQAPQDIGGIG